MSRRERIVWACAVVAVGLASGLISWRVGRDSGFELQKQFFLGMLNDEIDSREQRARSWTGEANRLATAKELTTLAPKVLNAAAHPKELSSASMLSWWENNRQRYVLALGEAEVEKMVPSSRIPNP